MNSSTIMRIEQLFPPLKVKAYQLIQQLSLQGIDVEVSQGLRTWPEQEALYAQGRTSPGPIVTNASPEKSWHTFACAFDFDIVTTDGGLDWTGNSPAWNSVISAGESLGLYSGAEFRTFPDKPHFQLTGRFPVTPDDEVLILFRGGGLAAVWAEITKSLPSP
jgi:peptidoglycan L-alanyl-D-glutamate endopeptidase CwlK